MLIEAVDRLLSIMATRDDYSYFTLDGQTIVLEDYLEVRPERERELQQLISRPRSHWPRYVMPDEFLVSERISSQKSPRWSPHSFQIRAGNDGWIHPRPVWAYRANAADPPRLRYRFGCFMEGIGNELRETRRIESPDAVESY